MTPIPGVQRNNFKEERRGGVEQKKEPAKMIDIEALKDKKYLFEQLQLTQRELGILAKDMELLKTQMNDLMEVVTELFDIIQDEEKRNEKFMESQEEQIEKPEEKLKDKSLEDRMKGLKKVSLFSNPHNTGS